MLCDKQPRKVIFFFRLCFKLFTLGLRSRIKMNRSKDKELFDTVKQLFKYCFITGVYSFGMILHPSIFYVVHFLFLSMSLCLHSIFVDSVLICNVLLPYLTLRERRQKVSFDFHHLFLIRKLVFWCILRMLPASCLNCQELWQSF